MLVQDVLTIKLYVYSKIKETSENIVRLGHPRAFLKYTTRGNSQTPLNDSSSRSKRMLQNRLQLNNH